MTTKTKTYGKPSIGCHLDQSYCNACEHDGRTIRLAMDYGYEPAAGTLKLLARLENDVLSDERDDAQRLFGAADEAVDWLNEQETRPFLYWANNGEAGALGLWPSLENAKEDCAFVSCKDQAGAARRGMECDPEDSSCPAADFRGEWLHVSDHGNATLYIRGEDGKDVEQWSCV